VHTLSKAEKPKPDGGQDMNGAAEASLATEVRKDASLDVEEDPLPKSP
jgi:hypothetical protein